MLILLLGDLLADLGFVFHPGPVSALTSSRITVPDAEQAQQGKPEGRNREQAEAEEPRPCELKYLAIQPPHGHHPSFGGRFYSYRVDKGL